MLPLPKRSSPGSMWTRPATAGESAGLWPRPPWRKWGGALTVEVLAGNLPALSLYRSLGFTQEEIVHGHMPGNEDFSVTVHCLSTPEEPRNRLKSGSIRPGRPLCRILIRHFHQGGIRMTIRQTLEQEEHRRLDPRAAFSDQSGAADSGAGAGGRRPHLLPARHRPHCTQQVVPPPDAQNPGLPPPGGGPLPNP